jgi:hypothetical protein
MGKLSQTEKAFTVAGLILIVVGCIANAYGAYVNQRFIYDPLLDPLYYFRYIILLLGGFAAGYIFVKDKALKVYNGVFYAAFAMALYHTLDIVRLLVRGTFGALGFPWEKIIFQGMSLFIVIVVFMIAYIAKKPNKQSLNPVSKKIFIAAFVAYELYSIASTVYYSNYEAPLLAIVLGYLISPLVIAIVSYFLLTGKKVFEKVFYASFIGVLYGSLMYVLWEFRIDASANTTMAFSTTTNIVALLCASVLVWRVRQLKTK